MFGSASKSMKSAGSILASVAAATLFVASVAAQDLPPPSTKPRTTPRPPIKGSGGGGSGSGGAPAPAPSILMVTTDLPCTLTIDGERGAQLKPNENPPKRLTVSQGQHLVACSDGTRQWQLVVDGKPGQQVVQVALATAGRVFSSDEFDRTMAQIYMGVSDLKVAGAYSGSILEKAWGFHNHTLTAALHTAHEYLKNQVADVQKMAPNEPARKKMGEDIAQIATTADKYIELMTKAISDAQKANSWQGEPSNQYGQAKALENNLTFPSDALVTLKTSAAFRDALPMDRQIDLGLAKDPRNFDLGALYYQSSPTVLAFVEKGGVAEGMGFKSGDRLVSVDGIAISTIWDFKLALRSAAGKKLQVAYEREGKQESREARPNIR